jgi:hypothetical protein
MNVYADEEPVILLARALFAQANEATLHGLLGMPRKTPARLTAGAMAALEESLSSGAALFVARNGAWRKEGGKRLWDKGPMPPLVFTDASFQFLRWLLGLGVRAQEMLLLPTARTASTGDELLLVAALATTSGTPWQPAIAWQPMVRESPLCAAGFALELGAVRALDASPRFDLTPGGWHAFAFEGLAELFAHQWAESEGAKRSEQLPARLSGGSQAQERVLGALLEAAGSIAARPPLTFLVEAAKKVLDARLTAQDYGAGLSSRHTLRERSEARLASGAMLRGLLKLKALDDAHRHTRFTDDGYDEAQALVTRWETAGPSLSQWATVEPTLSALGSA